MTDRLALYNGALLELGERKLASLSENREPRRLLDDVWAGGLVAFCLRAGQWRFATRTVQLAPETSIEPDFGYRKAYERPEDWLRTVGVYSDEYGNNPLLQYRQEQNFWFADIEPLYVSYISSDPAYGGNLAEWPPEFTEYVQAYLASRIVQKLTQDKAERARVEKLVKDRRLVAASQEAMEGPTSFTPSGSWVSARTGGRNGGGGRRDRGGRGGLLG